VQADSRCPGCGARNAPDARVCEWCGRPFLLRDQRRSGRWLSSVGIAVGALLGAIVVALALWQAFGLPRGGSTSPSSGAAALPTAAPTATPAPAAEQVGEPTPEPAEYVRVTNTGGQGVILRREPSTRAARVAARAENTVLQIVGPDQEAEGRVWRQVEDAQGNRGWVPADFLAPTSPPGA